MAHTLETLEPGTPVYVGDLHVGDLRAMYTEGNSRQVELLVVRWTARNEDIAIPATEVANLDGGVVRLSASDPNSYAELAAFDVTRFPTVHLLT